MMSAATQNSASYPRGSVCACVAGRVMAMTVMSVNVTVTNNIGSRPKLRQQHAKGSARPSCHFFSEAWRPELSWN